MFYLETSGRVRSSDHQMKALTPDFHHLERVVIQTTSLREHRILPL